MRREFGSPFKFTDRDANSSRIGALDSSFVACKDYQDPNFRIFRMEVDRAVQAVPAVKSRPAQTEW